MEIMFINRSIIVKRASVTNRNNNNNLKNFHLLHCVLHTSHLILGKATFYENGVYGFKNSCDACLIDVEIFSNLCVEMFQYKLHIQCCHFLPQCLL